MFVSTKTVATLQKLFGKSREKASMGSLRTVTALGAMFLLANATATYSASPMDSSLEIQAPSTGYKSLVVDLTFTDVSSALGLSTEKVHLARFSDGEFKPISFQIDEYNQLGNPYFKEEGTPIAGTELTIDKEDHLLFMARDGGTQQAPQLPKSVISEISFRYNGQPHFAYLVKGQQSEDTTPDYTHYNPQNGIFTSTEFTFQIDPDDPLTWKDLIFQDAESSLLDTMKARLTAGVLTPFSKLTLTNKNFNSKILAYKDGPIRTLVQTRANVEVMKVPVMTIYTTIMSYESRIDSQIKADIPAAFGKLMRNPSMSLSLDGNHLDGSEVRVAHLPGKVLKVNGKMDANERKLDSLDFKGENWWWLSNGKDLNCVTNIRTGKNFTATLSSYYKDDKQFKDAPERFQGQWPNMGYVIDDIDAEQTINFTIEIYLADGVHTHNPQRFISQYTNPPLVAVRDNGFQLTQK